MSSDLEVLIQIGDTILSIKYYAIATCTILFYDHLLTLADEIEYIWSGKKSLSAYPAWNVCSFLKTFEQYFGSLLWYFPITFQLWQITAAYIPHLGPKLCEKTSWYSVFALVVCTFLAQVVLALRIYAVAMKRTSVVIVFGTITVSQLAIGIWTTTFAAEGGVQPAPPIPLDAFQICIFTQNRSLEIAYTALSLSFDFLAFSLIILLAVTMRAPGLKVRSILETIAEDATKYFLIIFTSHLVVEVTLNLEQQMIRLLPAPGNVVYIPVMISRIILSLRKAADPLRKNQSLGESSDRTNLPSMKFNHPRRAAKGREDDMTIDTYSRSQTEV